MRNARWKRRILLNHQRRSEWLHPVISSEWRDDSFWRLAQDKRLRSNNLHLDLATGLIVPSEISSIWVLDLFILSPDAPEQYKVVFNATNVMVGPPLHFFWTLGEERTRTYRGSRMRFRAGRIVEVRPGIGPEPELQTDYCPVISQNEAYPHPAAETPFVFCRRCSRTVSETDRYNCRR
jgi:hypothetical protein